MSDEPPAVEVERVSGDREVALLEDTAEHGQEPHTQERAVVVVVTDGELQRVNVAADRVTEVDGDEADLARDIIGSKMEGS